MRLPRNVPVEKVRGNYVSVRGFRFKPERGLLVAVRGKARFIRLKGTTLSRRYTVEEMKTAFTGYLKQHGTMTRRTVQMQFSLTVYSARKWLRHFVDAGIIKKTGHKNAPVYMLS